jgi:hypothetical protein
VRAELEQGSTTFRLELDGNTFEVRNDLNEHERKLLLAGGLLRYLKGGSG